MMLSEMIQCDLIPAGAACGTLVLLLEAHCWSIAEPTTKPHKKDGLGLQKVYTNQKKP